MTEKEYLKLKEKIQAACKRDLEALDRVWSMSGGGQPPKGTEEGSAKKGQLIAAVREAVISLEGQFSLIEVEKALKSYDPSLTLPQRATLTQALSRMGEKGEIEVVSKGKGRAMTIYTQKKSPPQFSGEGVVPVA